MSNNSVPINPRPFMQDLIGKTVRIRLKWSPPEQEYVGKLVSTDAYFNVQLENAQEYEDGVASGMLGSCMIRCNNVLWILEEHDGIEPSNAVKRKAQNGDQEMSGA